MAKREAPDDLDGLTGRPLLVEVTLLPEADAGGRRWRPGDIRSRTIVALALLAAVGAVVVAALAQGSRRATPAPTGPQRPMRAEPPAAARNAGPAGVAAAYGFPLRCLSVTLASSNHAYARADFNRASLCGRYDGDVTAVFHRVDRRWRPVLDTTSYACPVATLSPAVQSELGVCP